MMYVVLCYLLTGMVCVLLLANYLPNDPESKAKAVELGAWPIFFWVTLLWPLALFGGLRLATKRKL